MHDKRYPARALAAYDRAMTRRSCTALPLDALPSGISQESIVSDPLSP